MKEDLQKILDALRAHRADIKEPGPEVAYLGNAIAGIGMGLDNLKAYEEALAKKEKESAEPAQ